VASFASELASNARVGCSLAVRIWIIGAFLFLIDSTAVFGSGISYAHRAVGIEVEGESIHYVPDLIHDGVFVKVAVKMGLKSVNGG
jgi:hypothetical protein